MLDVIKQKIENEIERLTRELTVTLPKAIQKAVEHGDLSENAEYKSALERQQFVQARLNHLTQRMGELSKVDLSAIASDRVGFGSRVTLEDVKSGEKVTYSIVFGDYIDLDTNQISMASPIGRALLGKKLDEEALVKLPRGDRHYRIIELTTLPEMVTETA
ncbi:MAG TPA: transcription elongation factor GreA [Longimicrobiales bacterium]|nr:transcription elongation factor GreA [Longimicrobiales bacterium]